MSKLLKDELGFQYYEELPNSARPCIDLHDFYRLKHGKKEWKKENIELKEGLNFLVYSPNTKVYYLHQIHEFYNVKNLIQYAEDNNLFIIHD